ncbi:MFS transporter [Ningiella sp. W23]|uniref:MFS transporter n=1 Tax=Ningiella sp. W23 TaxID=3023715 RepID=UPI003757F70D
MLAKLLGSFADLNTGVYTARQNRILLSITYAFYFGQLGVFVPYVGIYLDDKGLSSSQIGTLLAIVALSRIIGPNLWANYADRSGQAGEVLRFGCLLCLLTFVSILFVDSFWGMTLAFSCMMMFWTAVLPQLEVITSQATAESKRGYGAVRLWGSIGFMLCTLSVGSLLDVFAPVVIVYASIMTLAGLFISSMLIVSGNHQKPLVSELSHEKTQPYDKAVSNSLEQAKTLSDSLRVNPIWTLGFIAFLLGNTLLQMSFGSFYNFFTLYMQSLEYSGMQTGIFICLGVAAEVLIFIHASRLIKRFGVKALLVFSLLFTAMRWLLLGLFAEFTAVIVFTQLIHALSFGLTHAVSVFYLQQTFPKVFQSRAQALYVSIAFGFGGAAGSYIAGLTWQDGAGAVVSFFLAAACAFIGAICFLAIDEDREYGEEQAK